VAMFLITFNKIHRETQTAPKILTPYSPWHTQ